MVMKNITLRFFNIFLLLFLISGVIFVMLDLLPGSAAYLNLDINDAREIASIEKTMGLDAPLHIRYSRWVLNLSKGNLGKSLETDMPVLDIIIERLPVSLELMFMSQFLALLLAVPLAVTSALNADSLLDRMVSGVGLIFFSTPAFVIALGLILSFAIVIKIFPSTGFVPISESLTGNIHSLFLPAMSIALTEWVVLMRILRDSLINTLEQDYILNARSNGLSPQRVLFSHVLKPSSIGLITLIGINLGHLVGGAIVIEIIFAIPGFGSLLFDSVLSQDYPLVLGCVLITAGVFVFLNFIVDNVYQLIDPRMCKG